MISSLKTVIRKEQFEPGIIGLVINPFYIARKALLESIKELGDNISGKTLDVGCGTKPYEKYFKSSEYIGLEIETTVHREVSKADFFYDGTKFPFNNNEFDSIVTNQVFEHVFNPDSFLNEINRVLKKNGILLLTVPFVWDEHEQPYDFARYSSFGIKSVLEKNGFEIIAHRKTVTNFGVIIQLINGYIYKMTVRNSLIRQIVTVLVMFPLSILGIILSKILPSNKDLYLDNIILAKKVNDL
ncbi:MAG: methylase [Ignavibacteria bacterium GWC2_36_12]|nr:MAG: methylase [Ignavibacteria bacterium GWC2_36_12]OGV10741.1 MAG: methylase [Ignavibacteria bacterium RIFOXYB2_FULL_36_7]